MSQSVRVFVDVPIVFRRRQDQDQGARNPAETSTALVATPSAKACTEGPAVQPQPLEQAVAKQVRDYLAAHRSQVNFIAEIPHKNGKALWTTFTFSCKAAFAETCLNQLGEFGVGAKTKGIGVITVCPVQIERIGSLPVKVGYDEDSGLLSSTAAPFLPALALAGDTSPHAAAAPTSPRSSHEEEQAPAIDGGEHHVEHVVTEEHEVTEAPNASADPLTLESYTAGFRETIRARIAVDNVVELINGAAEFTFDYIMLVLVASLLAAMGLLSDNAVVIVASMLVSPLMGPILAVTFGLTVLDREMIKRGLVGEVVGLSLSVIIGFFCGLLAIPFIAASDLPTDQMWSRSTPDALVLGVAIAIPSGIGVALSVLGNNTSSLVGVAISASLLPPAVNTGILLATLVLDVLSKNGGLVVVNGRQTSLTHADLSTGALYSLLLTLSNILCIWISGVIMFRIKEITPVGKRSNFWSEYVPKARQFNVTLTRSGSEAARLKAGMRTFLERQQQAYHSSRNNSGAPSGYSAVFTNTFDSLGALRAGRSHAPVGEVPYARLLHKLTKMGQASDRDLDPKIAPR